MVIVSLLSGVAMVTMIAVTAVTKRLVGNVNPMSIDAMLPMCVFRCITNVTDSPTVQTGPTRKVSKACTANTLEYYLKILYSLIEEIPVSS